MDQKMYRNLILAVSVEKVLEELLKENKVDCRLLEIREKGVVWEISNPLGRDIYVVRTNFSGITSALDVSPPSVKQLIDDYRYMRQSASKPITEVLPTGTCLIFSTFKDAEKYSEKACGEVYRSYGNSNFISHTANK